MSSSVELQEYLHEQHKWIPLLLDRIKFNGSFAIVGRRFRILVNGSEVYRGVN